LDPYLLGFLLIWLFIYLLFSYYLLFIYLFATECNWILNSFLRIFFSTLLSFSTFLFQQFHSLSSVYLISHWIRTMKYFIPVSHCSNSSDFLPNSGPDIPGFLLQPFRKPKRIRTAFSPSQLLKLEHAFEKNHYVVGAERKQLAQSLSLTETQVTTVLTIYHPRGI
jgi:hypothetical protein